jgi:hypothetical protein
MEKFGSGISIFAGSSFYSFSTEFISLGFLVITNVDVNLTGSRSKIPRKSAALIKCR